MSENGGRSQPKPALTAIPRGKASKSTKSQKKGFSFSEHLRLQSLHLNYVPLLCIAFISLLHVCALSLFNSGFLLSRTTLEHRNTCDLSSEECTLPAKYDRAIILLIDALRYDFLLPVDPSSPKFDASHHNHLTTPIQLTRDSPENSLLFKSIADPPTTTLQRLKAITTGSLPTFVDAGSNFAGSRVEEDNWLEQAQRAGKRIAFMGDDTWLTIFPETIFAPNHSFPFDSFNVEDLDTVDAGVKSHIIPLLDQPASESTWDILLAHPLGLDHAGHRFGASHSETTRKLKEMDQLISKIVERMAEKDLLVVFGDHGMDAKGDHGGDSPEETEAGLWMYSKTALVPPGRADIKPFSFSSASLHGLLDRQPESPSFFTSDGREERVVSQISLVPSLSLLLGLALPFNNLGSIIPELFAETSETSWLGRATKETGKRLLQAIEINAAQMRSYLEAYAAHGSGGSDLAPFVPGLLDLYERAGDESDHEQAFLAYLGFTHEVLKVTRSIWARFDAMRMYAGLGVLAGSLLVLLRLYWSSKTEGCLWRNGDIRLALSRGIIGSIVGALAGLFTIFVVSFTQSEFLGPYSTVILLACVCSEVAIISYRRGTSEEAHIEASLSSLLEKALGVTILALHIAGFASNSYILWEDSTTLFLVNLPPLLLALKALQAPEARLRKRTIMFAIFFMALNRLAAFSSICREEQHPYCTATFYGSSGVSIASPATILGSGLMALLLPSIIGRYLDISKSRKGWAPFFLRYSFRGLLVGGALYWTADYLEHSETAAFAEKCLHFKILMARVLLGTCLLLATNFWWASPLCIDVMEKKVSDQNGGISTQVTVLGFANSIGSSYLLLFLPIFAMIFLLAQPMGQIVLGLGSVAILTLLEYTDSARDAALLRDAFRRTVQAQDNPDAVEPPIRLQPPSFTAVVTLVLLGFVLFFATGHQAVLSSIQWKIAFVGFPKLTYPVSPLLVVLNTLGPFILTAAAVPLLVFWNVTPNLKSGPTAPLLSNLLNACLAFLIYHTAITLSSAVFASHLRRHLMVWKVFAPRFMLAGITLLAVDATILVIVVGWGGLGTLRKLRTTFGTAWS